VVRDQTVTIEHERRASRASLPFIARAGVQRQLPDPGGVVVAGGDDACAVWALVLGCTTPGNAHGVRRPAHVDPVLLSGDPERMLPYLASLEWAAANRGLLAERNAWLLAHPVPPHTRQLHYLASEGHDAWDQLPQLPQITAPTLVIHGSDDEMNVVANARLLAERISGAELHIIAGARSVYFWDHGDEANHVVREFLERHPL
jgi:pimeloyl-ACP methyl ester carboxylesterase